MMVTFTAVTSPDRLDDFMANPRKAVWTMAVPMMAGTAVHTLYIIVDTAFIGALGTEALAAATFVGPVFFVMFTLTMGLGTAVTALVAQAVGRRESGGGDAVAGTAMTIGLAIGLLLMVAGLLVGYPLIQLLGASGDTAALGWEYFSVITLLVPFFFISTTLRSVLTGEGDARTPTLVMAAATAINLVLDPVFIFVLDLGLRGAALATGVAQLFTLVTFWFLVVRRKEAFVRFRASALLPSAPVLWQIARLGVPTAAGMFVMSVGSMAYNRVLANFGEVAIAAFGAASKVDMVVAMPVFGLASASVAVIGMFAGAGRTDLVRSTALYAYRWGLTIAVTIGIAAFLTSNWTLQIFTRDATALAIGRDYLGFMLFVYPMMAFGMTTGRLLQGLGHGVPSLVITLVRVLIVGVPIAACGVWLFDAPISVVWTAILLGALSSTVLSAIWVRRLVWQLDPTERARDRQVAAKEPEGELVPSGSPAD